MARSRSLNTADKLPPLFLPATAGASPIHTQTCHLKEPAPELLQMNAAKPAVSSVVESEQDDEDGFQLLMGMVRVDCSESKINPIEENLRDRSHCEQDKEEYNNTRDPQNLTLSSLAAGVPWDPDARAESPPRRPRW